MSIKSLYIFVSAFLILIVSTNLFPQSGNKSIRVHKTFTAPSLDGSANDSVWQSIAGDSSFLQIDPNPGEMPAFPTLVKLASTADALYVLFVCYDPDPSKIIAREMKYDGFTSGDDNVKLIIDTFGDQRNGYWFATNPLSVKNDALVSGRTYGEFNEDWDMLWEVKSAIHDDHWCAEFKLPFSSLKFPDKPIQNWKINFQRGIRRLSQDVISVGCRKEWIFIRSYSCRRSCRA
ncbi:hypothetical protein MASR1M107_15070 [Ignavibacteriales bacterium]